MWHPENTCRSVCFQLSRFTLGESRSLQNVCVCTYRNVFCVGTCVCPWSHFSWVGEYLLIGVFLKECVCSHGHLHASQRCPHTPQALICTWRTLIRLALLCRSHVTGQGLGYIHRGAVRVRLCVGICRACCWHCVCKSICLRAFVWLSVTSHVFVCEEATCGVSRPPGAGRGFASGWNAL